MSENQGPIEKLITEHTRYCDASVKRMDHHQVLIEEAILEVLESLPPLIPAPTWEPEGWVPVEPGLAYYKEGDVTYRGRLFELADGGVGFDGTPIGGDWSKGITEDCDNLPGRWCRLPSPPGMPE